MKKVFVVAVAALTAGIVSTAYGANTIIRNDAMSCPAARQIANDDYAPTLGFTDLVDKVITLNRRLLETKPRPLRRFVFLHECGHLQGLARETQADCWAVKQAGREGWLKQSHLRTICNSLGSQSRCQSLRSCFARSG